MKGINQTFKNLCDELRTKSAQRRDTHRDAFNKAKSRAKRDTDKSVQAEMQRQAQATEKYCWTLLQDAAFPTWGLPGNGPLYAPDRNPDEGMTVKGLQSREGQPATAASTAASYTAERFRELVDALIQEHTRLVPAACKACDGRDLIEECKWRVSTSLEDSDAPPTLGMLVLVDPSTGAVITHDAIEHLQEDPGGDDFPWPYSARQKAEWAAQERAAAAAAELQAEERALQAAQKLKKRALQAEKKRALQAAQKLKKRALQAAQKV